MTYQYHCQRQAIEFADAIIPVPDNYPLIEGLDADYREHFKHLCQLARNIYLDMAASPADYGLMLVDITETDGNIIRNGNRSIHRFVDTLSRLSQCGELKNHQLIVSLEEFRKAIKKGGGAVSQPVPKYERILSKLVDFGFAFSDFTGKPFDKKLEYFIVEYPDEPAIIDTIHTYCECWDNLKNDRSSVKIWPKEFHHHYYRFDYKITAERDKLQMLQWLNDEAEYLGYSPELKAFSSAFYEYSNQFKGLKFDGDYCYKSKRIFRIFHAGHTEEGKNIYKLSLKVKNMDTYQSELASMPESIQNVFTQSYCNYCGFQGSTQEYCKYRLLWNFNNTAHDGCAFTCFEFDDFNLDAIPHYFRLLELDYGLKKYS